MINIISDVSKESNSNKNYSNIEEINNDRMVDITQDARCGIFCKTKAFLSTFIIILSLTIFGDYHIFYLCFWPDLWSQFLQINFVQDNMIISE